MFPGITSKDSKWDVCFLTLMVQVINSMVIGMKLYVIHYSNNTICFMIVWVLSDALIHTWFIIYINGRESTIITRYIRYIQLTLNIYRSMHYTFDMVTYKVKVYTIALCLSYFDRQTPGV